MHLVRVMTKLLPQWLPARPKLFQALMGRWRDPARKARLLQEESLPRPGLLESKRLAKCIISYLRTHHTEITPLFELFTIFMVCRALRV